MSILDTYVLAPRKIDRAAPIQPVVVEDVAIPGSMPATAAQHELWLAEQVDQASSFAIGTYAEVNGSVDRRILQEAVAVVLEELPVLRSRFHAVQGVLTRTFDAPVDDVLVFLDFADEVDARSRALAWISEDHGHVRSIESRGLYAFVLLRFGENAYFWYQRYHHAIIDGRSAAIVVRRISEVYRRLFDGEVVAADICTVTEESDDASAVADAAFWKSTSKEAEFTNWLARGSVPPSDMDADSFVEVVASDIDDGMMRSLSERHRVSLSSLWVSAIAAYFHALVGRTSLQFSFPVIGVTKAMAGRPGMTSNVLPLVVEIDPDADFLSMAASVQRTMLRALRHQRYRGEDIRRMREGGRGRWFGPSINLMTFDCGEPFPSCAFQWHVHSLGPVSDFNLAVIDYCDGRPQQVHLKDLVSETSQEQLDVRLEALGRLARALAENPGRSLRETIRLADPQEVAVDPFYGRRRGYRAAGYLLWQSRAEDLRDVMRALDFGGKSHHPLGHARVGLPRNHVFVRRLRVLPVASAQPPGTLLKLDRDGWIVSTATHDVRIEGFFGADGMTIDIAELAASAGLRAGDVLPMMDSPTCDALSALAANAFAHERFWVERLSRFRPLRLSADDRVDSGGKSELLETAWHVVDGLESSTDDTLVERLLTAFAVYGKRLAGEGFFQAGWVHAPAAKQDHWFDGLVASQVPFQVDLDETDSVACTRAKIRAELVEIRNRGSFFRDLPARHASLRGVEGLQSLRCWPVSVELLDSQGSVSDPSRDDVSEHSGVTLQISPGTRSFRCVGREACFDTSSLDRMSERLLALVHAIDDPACLDMPVDRLDMLPASERQLLLETWNATSAPYDHDVCVHTLFERQVARAPDAVAVVSENETLSYGELNAQANRLAHHLIDLGVRPDDRVAICAERGLPMVVGLLGILKAGGAYVPLDPAYASERLAVTLVDAAPAVVLADATGRTVLGEAALAETQVVDVDAMATLPARTQNPVVDGLTPDRLMYVIYTSGSTGVPKGVMMEHRALVNRLTWMQAAYGLDGSDAVLQKTSFSFDVSVWEFFWTLLEGARLVVPPPAAHKDAAQLVSLIRRHAVTTLHFVPSMLGVFLDADGVGECTSLRRVVCSGEALTAAQARTCVTTLPHARLHNLYGPTEAAIDVTAWTCPVDFTGSVVPIGRPIANTRIYLLDTYGQPVPQGAMGELHIGGDGVARGYLNRPALSAERFVDDPFVGTVGARMYRTGDLARYLPDGEIEYLGRNDHQVKIRGFRIELGEIEARLGTHPQVREAVVLAREDVPGEKRLVAYVIGVDGITPDAASLRAHVAEGLPDYMLPAAFVAVDAWPLTPNGKLDRKALPAPEGDAFLRREYLPPQRETETTLAGLWQELLGVERVGRHDHFFELGGHSLLGVRLIARIRQAWQVELPISALFDHPVLADLATLIDQADEGEVQAPIAPASESEAHVLSYAQQRLWFLAQMEATRATYHIPVALHLHGTLDVPALERALDTLWMRHEALRTIFITVDGEPLTEVRVEPLTLPLEPLSGTLTAMAAQEAEAAFDLSSGPLLRARLIALGPQEHALLLTQHHIVSDGWSLGVFARELGVAYAAYREGRTPVLPTLPIRYADYAAWQRRWLSGERLERQVAYWREALVDAPVLLELPTDRPRPAQQDFHGAVVPIHLDGALASGLRRLGQRHGTTLFMTLLAGWSAVLSRLSGQDEVVIGTPVANRGRRETEGLIGFFVNTLALPVDFSDAPSVSTLLERVRARALSAQENQDLPFEQVVERVQPPRRLDHTPLFQVMFAWQNTDGGLPSLPGVQVSRLPLAYDTAKFDLELDLAEDGDAIVGTLTYATALFDATTAERYVGYLHTMLRAMVADATQPVAAIDVLSSSERRLLLETWNATSAPYDHDVCVHALFERQAARAPDAVAVVCEDETLTYGELNAQANRLAHHLIDLGVRPDDRVAICAERGLPMVVGLLGILKAGGAYVPLDPAYASERLAVTLADAAPTVVLADATGRAVLGETALAGSQAVDLAAMATLPARTDNPVVDGLTPDHLMYVIYTSGSTGVPKGVMVEHRSVCHQVTAFTHVYGLLSTDRYLQFSSPSFDVSVEEIFGALLNGACLVLRTDAWLDSARAFDELCTRHGITIASLPTAFWSGLVGEWADMPSTPVCPSRFVIGGEAVGANALEKWFDGRGKHAVLFNAYGPTETTVNATIRPVTPTGRYTSIGRPMANTRIYLLDEYGQPVPRGTRGELYIGGDGVARGYLNLAALTAERFVDDPFAGTSGARMYRTGDLARYLPDGEIEYLGRDDHQVKIRGFRIELSEIEARLGTHAQVREAVVLAREDVPGEKRLVAYVIGTDGTTPDASSLRAHVAEGLPDYMLPAAFVAVHTWPLTPNGKLDRKALPAPDDEDYLRRDYSPPQGDVEQALTGLWQEMLGVERVGRHDHFFELGGHSLLGVRLIARIRQAWQVELPISALFARPVLADLATLIEQTDEGEAQAPITSASGAEAHVLSYAQQRLWFLAQMDSHATYHIPVALHLHGALDVPALGRALDTLWMRHEALRTVFVTVDGEPRTDVRAEPISVQVEPLAGPLDAMAAQEAEAAFDLSTGPLLRARLIAIGPQEHALLLTQHHIVSDGWSLGVFARELGMAYAAYREGRTPVLPALPIRYADYAAWQRRWLSGERLERQVAYWREALADAPVLLELPTDRPRPAQQDFHGAAVPIHLDAALASGLRRLGQRHGTTLFMTLLAAWSAVLSRLSGQDEVVIGTPVANRGRRETEGLIGFFVNTLALPVDLSDTPSVSTLLERVRTRALSAQENQDLPFEQVVERVQPPRRLDHTPLFQVMFAWQNTDGGLPSLPGLEVSRLPLAYDTAKFDLELDLAEDGEAIAGTLTYATALFDAATAERYVGYLQTMLRAMVADATQPVAAIDVLSSSERRLVLETWNATSAPYDQDVCVHTLFERQAARAPDAVAVVCEDETLTYGELNAQANCLAHHLIDLGVRPDDRVAICAERGLPMVVGLLGILKAGGAYVPLDPAYASERLAVTLTDAAPAVVLADVTGRSVLGEAALADSQVIDLDALAMLPARSENPLVDGLTPDHLMYVIYTSGSTGVPKGVMMEHRALVNRLTWMQAAYGLDGSDAVLQKTSFSFDVSVWEFFWTLLEGARLVVPPPAAHKDAAQLVSLIRRHGVTTLHFVPSMLGVFLDADGAGECTSLRRVVCSGEALTAAQARTCVTTLPHARLHNLYGPTEAAIDVTAWTCPVDFTGSVVPIGRPIANTRIYLLDTYGQPVPQGAMGELHIGGDGVARGYLNRSALSAERFVDDPFVGTVGARMYRTGDLARYLPDGQIEYLGRNDHQVKIRGFRIELGEIEARLGTHPQVREAVVLAREDVPGENRLVAYVIGVDGITPDAASLRAHVAEGLPDYMLPAAFVAVDAWPLTPNGKLDRKALPAPDGQDYLRRDYAPPQGDIEQVLAGLWQEMLGVERVGRHDDFFELGGHSLLAIRLLDRVRHVFSVELPLTALFLQPSLDRFATLVGQTRATEEAMPPIAPASEAEAHVLSYAQQRLWFLAQMEATRASYHMPVALYLHGTLDVPALERALDTLWMRHEALRTVFITVDGEPLTEVRIEPLTLPLEPLSGTLTAMAAQEAEAAFDLSRGPLLRARLIAIGPQEHALLLTQHHIVSDGWSLGVFARELGIAYAAYREGRTPALPVLPIRYADYAAWQRRWLSGERLERQVAYWRDALADAPVLLELPTDRPRPAQQDFHGAVVPIQIDAALASGLRRLGQRHGTTLFMTLLAAWSSVLSRLSGQDEVVIGTPVANRGRRETEGLIGFFVNTLALPVDLSDTPSVSTLLERVRTRALSAQENQDLPFEQVVERVQPPRRLDHTPLFQVMFAWQNTEGGLPSLPGLEVSRLPLAYDTAKFDLELDLAEDGEAIAGTLTYATALFDAATAERYVGYLHTMLRAMVADATQPVAGIDVLSSEERQLLLETWNATEAPYDQDVCVHTLFERQAAHAPDAVAVVCDDTSLTYGELNAQANRLAHHLIDLGVRPDDRVAICVERGLPMVVGLLGILKAGGAYVPLDPAYPTDRLGLILQDSRPRLLVSDEAGRHALGEGALAQVTRCDLDTGPAPWDHSSIHDPVIDELRADHLAYIIYTSGSTGVPKGVMVEHRSFINHWQWQVTQFDLGPDDVFLQRTSIAFDASVWELWTPLALGSTVTVLPRQAMRDVASMHRYAVDHGVSVVQLIPSMLSSFVRCGDVDRLRYVFCGGEPLKLDPSIPRDNPLLTKVVNLYGPTETTIDATSWVYSANVEFTIAPIGRPVANTRIYLLDAYGQPVPRGTTGELYIGGDGVARGYLNLPALSAERFVDDPFVGTVGARMYRSGDLARYLPDGEIEYLGRNDHQVKIRGFRIEPGEIETRLAEHPAVNEAVVIAREDSAGDKRLVAYVTARTTATEAMAGDLRAHLGARLPDYMVPAAYVVLDAMPLTPNGKLDRKALPAPDGDAYAHRVYAPAQGEIEAMLAGLWQELLGVEQVSRHDDFFELGGHSLLVVRLIARIRQARDAELPISAVFAHPVLADLATLIEQTDEGEAQAPIAPASIAEAHVLSYAQQRLWFLSQMEAISATYHIPIALHLHGTLDVPALERALDTLRARHEALRTVFVTVDGQPRTEVRAVEPLTLPLEPVSGTLAAMAAQEAEAAFNLSTGPLLRARLIALGPQEHALLLTQHHIVSDGWSLGVFARELGMAYAAYREGRTPVLPALPIRYADYAAWQRRWLSGERLERQVAYWRDALADAPVLLELPTDRPRPAQQDFHGAVAPIQIDAALASGLRRLGQRHGTTLFMTLLAAWSAVLSRLSGQDEVVIGTPVANRGRRETEGLIGFFVNTLALPVDLSDTPSVSTLLERVRTRALSAQENQDLPFEQVVERVQPPRRLDHTPLFQVMFVWQNNDGGLPSLPGLDVSRLPLAYDTAKFDLELSLAEEGEAIVGTLTYATVLFDAATAERYVGYLETMLRAMVADATQPVAAIDVLSSAERRLLLETWNATEAPYDQEVCVHTLFERQAARAPDAVAVVCEGERLTYGELNAQANRLAHHLIDLGVRPDDRVAICVERGLPMVVGLLGILKAGGAYVPLDPAYASERLALTLTDAVPSVVLADATGRTVLGEAALAEARVVALESLGTLPARNENPVVDGLTPERLMYVIYTSGSTGVPKGVVGMHKPVINLIEWIGKQFGVDDKDVLLFTTSISFDLSVYDIFGMLAAGGSIRMANRHDVTHPDVLARIIMEDGITFWDSAPAVFQQMTPHLLAASHGSKPSSLRLAFFSGDWIPLDFYDAITSAFPHCLMVSLGGATEATVWSNFFPVTRVDPDWVSIPYGKPMQNARYFVLDDHMNPLPRGTRGNLYIGGDCLTLGYLGREDLTAERFLDDVYTGHGGRLYKTGDLARYLPDGNLQFLGRKDHQVKIRGFRIELGEIEARLLEHDAVQEAIVLARQDAHGEKRLVAYAVLDADASVADLRRYLAAALPEYMVPSAFVRMPSFPLTTNGKIDRGALPEPDGDAVARKPYEAPQGDVEELLASEWRALLGIDEISRHDDFFGLGGHSLMAITLIDTLRQRGLDIDIRSLFTTPVLSELAVKTTWFEEIHL